MHNCVVCVFCWIVVFCVSSKNAFVCFFPLPSLWSYRSPFMLTSRGHKICTHWENIAAFQLCSLAVIWHCLGLRRDDLWCFGPASAFPWLVVLVLLPLPVAISANAYCRFWSWKIQRAFVKFGVPLESIKRMKLRGHVRLQIQDHNFGFPPIRIRGKVFQHLERYGSWSDAEIHLRHHMLGTVPVKISQ